MQSRYSGTFVHSIALLQSTRALGGVPRTLLKISYLSAELDHVRVCRPVIVTKTLRNLLRSGLHRLVITKSKAQPVMSTTVSLPHSLVSSCMAISTNLLLEAQLV